MRGYSRRVRRVRQSRQLLPSVRADVFGQGGRRVRGVLTRGLSGH
jgi:hypothetical protein